MKLFYSPDKPLKHQHILKSKVKASVSHISSLYLITLISNWNKFHAYLFSFYIVARKTRPKRKDKLYHLSSTKKTFIVQKFCGDDDDTEAKSKDNAIKFQTYWWYCFYMLFDFCSMLFETYRFVDS